MRRGDEAQAVSQRRFSSVPDVAEPFAANGELSLEFLSYLRRQAHSDIPPCRHDCDTGSGLLAR